MFFFFNDTATTEIYTLSLHDALPICLVVLRARPAQLLAQPLGLGEELAELLLADLRFRLQGGVPLLALGDLGLQLLASGLHLGSLLLHALHRAREALPAFRKRRGAHLGL